MVGNATSLVEAHHNDIVAAPTVWEDDGKQIGHRWCVFRPSPLLGPSTLQVIVLKN
jgi:hypothetical protein